MGLGNLTAIAGVREAAAPRAAWGVMREASAGKDTITGHWEMAGLRHQTSDGHVPRRLPAAIVAAAARRRGPRHAGQQGRVGHRDHRRARRPAHGDRRPHPLHVGRLRPADRGARGDRAARRAVPDLRGGARDRRPPPHRARHRAAVRGRARRVPPHLQPPRLLAGAARADAARPRARRGPVRGRHRQDLRHLRRARRRRVDPQRGQHRRHAPDARGAGDAQPRAAVREPGRLRHGLRAPQRRARASCARCANSTPGCPSWRRALRPRRRRVHHRRPRQRSDHPGHRPHARAGAAAGVRSRRAAGAAGDADDVLRPGADHRRRPGRRPARGRGELPRRAASSARARREARRRRPRCRR